MCPLSHLVTAQGADGITIHELEDKGKNDQNEHTRKDAKGNDKVRKEALYDIL